MICSHPHTLTHTHTHTHSHAQTHRSSEYQESDADFTSKTVLALEKRVSEAENRICMQTLYIESLQVLFSTTKTDYHLRFFCSHQHTLTEK